MWRADWGAWVRPDTFGPRKRGIVRRASSTAALVVAAAAVALTAACGGSSGDTSGTGQTNQNDGSGGNNAFTAYVQCLQKNGVTITLPSGQARNRPSDGASRGPRPSGEPRPSASGFPRNGGGGFPGGGGFGMQKPDGVDEATWDKAQTACASLRPSGRAGGNRGNNGANAAYRNCLKDHGVTATDGRLDTNDETVKKAVAACKVLQPQASATPSA
jgi:hypothetical protein